MSVRGKGVEPYAREIEPKTIQQNPLADNKPQRVFSSVRRPLYFVSVYLQH